ncbi:hypothetical protein EOA25_28640 [Mesorhizobium sp. M2A.F.Ca.ET.040.01.1.1]|nr:hypothetical protein EOA25_28640 [Mesorhizobium sp. M2A.F.Ca.ET.040.01.1.1]
MDTLSPSARSERMSRVRGRDTKPEMRVRRLVHAMAIETVCIRSELASKRVVCGRGRNHTVSPICSVPIEPSPLHYL